MEFKTFFTKAVVNTPNVNGSNTVVSGGVDLNGGQKQTGNACGQQVTTVSAGGVGNISGSVGVGGTIANKS